MQTCGSHIGVEEGPHPNHLELQPCSFFRANLRKADFSGMKAQETYFQGADCTGSDFSGSTLVYATFRSADLARATFASTIFANIDFSECRGLESTVHETSSSLGVDTLR